MLRYVLILTLLSGIFGHQEFADESQNSSTSYNKTTPKKKKQKQCLRNKYGLKKLENQDVELTYCFEHGPRTCCANADVVPIRQKMSLVKHTANPKINDQCFAVTSRVMCSTCDADIGTGVNSEGALCLNFCDEWLFACQNEFIDPYLDVSEHIPFCREDSLVCSPVTDVVKSSRNFCEYMGFKVASTADTVEQQNEKEKDAFLFIDEDEEQQVKIDKSLSSQEKCFSGFPRQIISLGHMNRTRKYQPKDRNQELLQQVRETIQRFLDSGTVSMLWRNKVKISGLSVVYALYQIIMHFYYNSKSSKAARYQNSQTQAQMRVNALEKLRKEKKDAEAAKKKNKKTEDTQSQNTDVSVKNNEKQKEDKKAGAENKSSIKKIMEQIRQSRQDRAERQNSKEKNE